VLVTCNALPEVVERLSHGAPTFFIRDKRSFAAVRPDGHHDNDFPHVVLAAAPGVQSQLIERDPDTYFRPPYVGPRRWIGVRLDRGVTKAELEDLCEDAYRAVAPVTLLRQLDDAHAEPVHSCSTSIARVRKLRR
jgi:hypothetical protein